MTSKHNFPQKLFLKFFIKTPIEGGKYWGDIMKHRYLLSYFSTFATVCVFAGCREKIGNQTDLKDLQLPSANSNWTAHWAYNGPLPSLDYINPKAENYDESLAPKITVSLAAHTVRITGYLPESFNGILPKHVFAEVLKGRKRIFVAYPISTGSHPSQNPEAKEFKGIAIFPFTPHGINQTMPDVAWAGLPWIAYAPDFKKVKDTKNDDKVKHIPIAPVDRTIAFHSPVEVVNGMLHLTRGPVSHGCNRMQGEHVVEMAHLLGVDMSEEKSKNYTDQSAFERPDISVTVLDGIDYIKEDGNFKGMGVDVDYQAASGVKRPQGSVMMFRTWKGGEHKDWVYPIQPKK